MSQGAVIILYTGDANSLQKHSTLCLQSHAAAELSRGFACDHSSL